MTTILLATAQDAGYRITAKYAWLVLLVPVTFVFTMFDPYRWYWQIIFFVAFAAMWALLYALAVYLPIGSFREVDPFYMHKMYAMYVFLFMGVVSLVGVALLYAWVVWIDSTASLQTGMLVMTIYAGVIFLASLVIAASMDKQVMTDLKIQSRPIAVDSTDDGTFLRLESKKKRSIQLSERYSTN